MRESELKVNIPYKGALMAIARVNDCYFFLEYEHRFDAMRIIDLNNFSKQLDGKIKEITF
jgi:hypothetical protein